MASAIEICEICFDARNISVLAVEFCPYCEDKLCEGCLKHHITSKATRNHKTISIENYNELPQFIRDIKQQCSEHDEIYQSYCINHEAPLCNTCVVTTHKYCKDTMTLNAMTHDTNSFVSLDFLESRIKDVRLNVQNILQDRKDNLNMVQQEKKDILKEISDSRSVVNDLFDKLEEQMKEESESITNRLEKVIEDFEGKNTKLNQTLESISKIKLYASNLQVVLGIKEMENQVQIDEKFIDSMVFDGSLKQINIHFKRNFDMKLQPNDFGHFFKEENPAVVKIVSQNNKQAQQIKNKTVCKEKGKCWAQISFEAVDDKELSICQGDKLTILDESDNHWWRVSKYDPQKNIPVEGLVPANFVTQEEYLYFYDWFFGPASKVERDKLILRNGKISGSFMVTECAEDTYTLSVLYRDNSTIEGVVHDYSICYHNVSGYYLNTNEKVFFNDVPKLVEYYSHTADGLCEKLIEPLGLTINKDEILKESVEFNTSLHFGRFRDIWQGTMNKSVKVAVAVFKTGPHTKIAWESEMYVLRQCRHERIIKLYGVYSVKKQIYIITELASKGNLLNVLRSNEGQKWKFPHIIKIAEQIADGMKYLEKKKIVHKNLAAKHILLVDDSNIKITDFKLTFQDDRKLVDDGKVFLKWIAPEAAFLGQFSTKSDVWSFGIVLIELISHGKDPYPGATNAEVIEMIQTSGYRHPKPKNCSEALYEIMMNCWKTEPETRPTFEYLLSVFEDYFVSVEEYYEEIDEDM